jgi:HAD superfamily hydrolase (TIGR01450 family)
MANVNEPVLDSATEQTGLPTTLRTVLCDLDGVVWLAREPIPGSVDAIERLRAAGCRVVFVTNNSGDRVASQETALAAIGIEAVGDVITSAQAAALLVDAGERVLVCGGEGVVEALVDRRALVVDDGPCDVVVVGIDRRFDYDRLTRASRAVRGGARLIGTNDDATFPTPSGPIPGGGSIVAAVATASGTAPVVAGKPHGPMVTLARRTVGPLDASSALMVGDRPSTDGAFAAAIGCGFALVRSGVTGPGVRLPAGIGPEPVLDVADLAAVADAVVEVVGRAPRRP